MSNPDLEYWEKYFLSSKQLQFPQEIVIRFLHTTKVNTGSTMLDLGCGNGVNGLYAEHLGYNVTYYDYSKNAIDLVKKRTNAGAVIHSDIKELGHHLTDNLFDVIISTSVLYHLEKNQLALTLADIHKKLNKDALLFCNFIASTDPLVKETVNENGVHYLIDESWITSIRSNDAITSKIVFESFEKSELQDIFQDFNKVKIYPSRVPASLMIDREEINTRDNWWVLASV